MAIIYSVLLGGIVVIMIYLIIKYRYWVKNNPEIKISEILGDIFRISLPVDKVLKYRSAVCRDYAKLTASLLFNIYPDSELYFIAIPSHVTVGINIENKCYVLDQHLPILSLDRWLIKWNKKADIYPSKFKPKSEGKPKVTFDFYRHEKKRKKSKEAPPKVNTENLAEEIAKVLGIKPRSHIDNPDLEIPLHDYATLYEDDEIIKYSLIRAIKNRLESEFCGNMGKISKFNIRQKERDLTVAVSI